MKDDYNKYDDQIKDIDEITGTDIKINPDFYLHNAIIKAQQSLVKEDTTAGFLQFIVIVNNMEIIAKSAKMLPKNYDLEIGEYKKSQDYKENKDRTAQLTSLANKKMELILGQVFSAKTVITSLQA